ncbi:hypothetical protein [Georgenia faecalis]|uniref:hypothetical protein n=1 Tax=Georgenia faecalis TaxID=2483799 RepID=UPI000FD82DEE|nr:hypothetical protein [Georgenia faecalis]
MATRRGRHRRVVAPVTRLAAPTPGAPGDAAQDAGDRPAEATQDAGLATPGLPPGKRPAGERSGAPTPVPEDGATPGPTEPATPVREPVLPDRASEDSDTAWGEYRGDSNDDRLRRDKPPHWG